MVHINYNHRIKIKMESFKNHLGVQTLRGRCEVIIQFKSEQRVLARSLMGLRMKIGFKKAETTHTFLFPLGTERYTFCHFYVSGCT